MHLLLESLSHIRILRRPWEINTHSVYFPFTRLPITASNWILVDLLDPIQHHFSVVLKRNILNFLIIKVHCFIIRLIHVLSDVILRIKRHNPVTEGLTLLNQLVLSLFLCLNWIISFQSLQIKNFDKQDQNVLSVLCENGLAFNHVFGVGYVTFDFKKLFDV